MNIFQATADFERWLPKRLPIVRQDMALKHQQMAEAVLLLSRNLLPLAPALAEHLPRTRERAFRSRCRRPARRKFWHLARRRRPSHLGCE